MKAARVVRGKILSANTDLCEFIEDENFFRVAGRGSQY